MTNEDVVPFLDLAGQEVELAKVRAWASEADPESAHVAEKDLWRFTLVAIGAELITGEDAVVAARNALLTMELDFPRWFA